MEKCVWRCMHAYVCVCVCVCAKLQSNICIMQVAIVDISSRSVVFAWACGCECLCVRDRSHTDWVIYRIFAQWLAKGQNTGALAGVTVTCCWAALWSAPTVMSCDGNQAQTQTHSLPPHPPTPTHKHTVEWRENLCVCVCGYLMLICEHTHVCDSAHALISRIFSWPDWVGFATSVYN